MQLFFKGEISELEPGIKILEKELNFQLDEKGTHIQVENVPENIISVSKKGNTAFIKYNKKIHFFRALGLFVEAFRKADEFSINEEPQFTMNGVMIDIAQGNAALNSRTITGLLTKMAVMGLNMFMLYSEDNYAIKDEPYFGYMRGKYTTEELKALDDYADMFGIEMIPCIQTLAHLTDVLRWSVYSDIKDDDATLLVGSPKTYEFIEKMIKAAIAPFRTKRIHIGMDEALNLGLGRYLKQNGYTPKFDLMTRHLNKVIEITNKFDLNPMIWSDMYFSAGSKNGDYYDPESFIPQSVIDETPKEAKLVYWDYYHHDEAFYTEWIKRHRRFGSDPVFAGAVWSWKGYCTNYYQTFATTNAALNTCKREGIKEAFITIWGDVATESNIFSNILGLQLYAEHGYAKELDEEKLKERFKFCTGGNFESFMDLQYLDEIPGAVHKDIECLNPSKYLMWQDLLMGLFDRNADGFNLTEHYGKLREKMQKHIHNNGEYGFVFEFIEKVCDVLSIKSEMGLRITKAYMDKDMQALRAISVSELPSLYKKVDELRVCHREQWMQINKPFGWEIIDIRYGGLLARIDSTCARIIDFVEGKISNIEELEEERLYYSNTPGLVNCFFYHHMISASRISG